MPSLKSARIASSTMTNGAKTIGQIHKENSDFAMEKTWDFDVQSKTCFIYDYMHDNQPELNKHMTYENTTKTRIDAKFIITSYGSIDKDQVAYHLMFRPSQKVWFEEGDELHYFETDYRQKYGVPDFPIGMFVDIPDEKNIYTRWLICDVEEGNQFIKYQILPCDYRFQWISIEGGKRVKRQMWGCTRLVNNYGAGTWIDRFVNITNDIFKCILPINPITETIYYVGEDGENQRMIIGAKVKNPLVWKLTKVENAKPIGLFKMTFTQDVFNDSTDVVNDEGMWANYLDSGFTPINPGEDAPIPKPYDHCQLSTSSYSIKNNSSYKTITSIYLNNNEEDISSEYSSKSRQYFFEVDGTDVSEYITYAEQTDKNIIKLKFNNSDYIGKILRIRTLVDYVWGELKLEII